MKRKFIIISIIMLTILLVNIFNFKYSNKYTDAFKNMYDFEWKNYETFKFETNEIYTQTIISKKNNLNNIRIYINPIDNYYANFDNLTLFLELTLKDDYNHIIQSYKYGGVFFDKNNSYFDFKFDPIKNSKNKIYILEIKSFDVLKTNSIYFAKVFTDSKAYRFENIDDKTKSNNSTLFYDTMYYSKNKILLIATIYAFVFISFFTLIFIILKKKNIKIENKYLIISIAIGMMFVILIPPYKGNDEASHFIRTYEISNGHILSDRVNGWPEAKVPSKIFDSFNNYTSFKKKYNSKKTGYKYFDMEYSTVYSIVSYIPHINAAIFCNLFISNLFWWPYIIRIVQLLFCALLIYYSIKIIPYGKKIVFIIGLLPSVLRQISLISADSLLISCTILFISYSLYLNDKGMIMKKDTLVLTFLAIVLSLSKLVYIPLCFLFLILTNKISFNSKKKSFIVMFTTSLVLTILWNYFALDNLASGQGVNVGFYVKYFAKNPFDYIFININTILKNGFKYVTELFGEYSSAFKLNANGIYSIIFFTIYCSLSITMKKFPKKNKLFIGFICLLTVILINLSLLVACTPIYTSYIVGIQGRYFLPILLPLSFILGKGKKKENFITKNYDIITIITYFSIILDIVYKYF